MDDTLSKNHLSIDGIVEKNQLTRERSCGRTGENIAGRMVVWWVEKGKSQGMHIPPNKAISTSGMGAGSTTNLTHSLIPPTSTCPVSTVCTQSSVIQGLAFLSCLFLSFIFNNSRHNTVQLSMGGTSSFAPCCIHFDRFHAHYYSLPSFCFFFLLLFLSTLCIFD